MKKLLTILILLLAANSQKLAASSYKPLASSLLSDTAEIAKAHSLHEKVIEEGRFISSFAEALSITLPQGIKKTIGGRENIIVIESLEAILPPLIASSSSSGAQMKSCPP